MSTNKPHLVAVAPVKRPTPARARGRANLPPTDGSLALHYPADSLPSGPNLRLVRDPAPEAIPDITAWAARLAQAIAEVVVGDRPVAQLVRWVEPSVYADLYRRVRVLGLTTSAGIRTASDRSSVRSIRLCTPTEGAVEVAAHVRHGARSRAIALRLELHRDRWICTALQMG
ncbi:Rv3235 family protein [Kribbella deserti]|uniref:Rv3235 family protein n=1 Tax=Kribbella deserti TaxID=1926257 RepID=A0ABV6QPS2_9ACTN